MSETRERKQFSWSEARTRGGHLCEEASSALQKSIRRGQEREALWWAAELDLAGYGGYLWRRLAVIASEDVGLADTDAVLLVAALRSQWEAQRKARKAPPGIGPESIFLAHAVMVLARAPKDRTVDDAACVVWWEGHEQMQLEVPDVAIDKHTTRGKALGRGWAEFYAPGGGAHVENAAEAIDNPYADAARAIRLGGG